MKVSKLYAFYGSLRMGMDLNTRFSPHLQYGYSCWLKGYALYSLDAYPYAVHSANSIEKIKVEIFRITDSKTEHEIRQIEMEAGYQEEKIEMNGAEVSIFLFEKATNDQKVISGDWVEFFGR